MISKEFGPSEADMGLSEGDKHVGDENEIKKSIEALDEKWYERFKTIGSFIVGEYTGGNKEHRADQKQKFLNGEIENPVLDYTMIDQNKLAKNEEDLLELKKEIIEQESNETIKQAYRWKINEKIAGVRFLRSVANGDMRRFRRYTEFIYGKPSPEIFAYTVSSLKNIVEQYLDSENPNIKKAAEELNGALPSDLSKAEIMNLPSKEDTELVLKRTLSEIGDLYNIPAGEEDKQYTADEIRVVFEGALEKLKADGWSVEIDLRGMSISVNQEYRKVKVPESRKVPFKTLQTLVAHEIGTHVARRIKGERSKLQLLGLGLDRYGKGEEGVATMKEQVIRGNIDDFAGLLGHLAISLAYGLDGQPRDFRQVYNIMVKHSYLKGLLAGKEPEEAKETASASAWGTTLRAFNGTNCITPGVCFTNDIIYREGNIGAWSVVRQQPEELARFSVGKYDPANMRHIWILDQLGISDKDLEDIK